jgi:alkylhydroperoxidase family enzyme
MLRWLIRRKLDAEEKKLGESVDYLRHIVDVSPAAFLRFASILPLANSRNTLPKEPWFVAQLVTLQHEDCGTCLQIGVNLARQAGVESAMIRAVLAGDEHLLPNDLADVARFTKAILTASDDDDALRQTLRERYGERGLIELAYAIAGSRIPPTVKRTLGYAKSCSLVPVAVR